MFGVYKLIEGKGMVNMHAIGVTFIYDVMAEFNESTSHFLIFSMHSTSVFPNCTKNVKTPRSY